MVHDADGSLSLLTNWLLCMRNEQGGQGAPHYSSYCSSGNALCHGAIGAMACGLVKDSSVAVLVLLPLCQPPKFLFKYFLMEINIVFF